MPKLLVYCDELYPYYGTLPYKEKHYETEIELSDEEYADYKTAADNFFRWQNKLRKLSGDND